MNTQLRSPWLGLLVAALALAASGSGLGNGYVFDDVPIILHNPLVHDLALSGTIWQSPYWPAGLLYRPMTVQLFAIQWAIGDGQTIIFHASSILLKMLVAVLFWRLARRILPAPPALAASALFAVHPVHAESVANIVSQAELLAAGLTLLAVERYLAWRERGPLSRARRLVLAGFTLLAILSKETGYVIPALLVAAEVLLVPGVLPEGRRVRQMLPVLGLQMSVAIITVLVRIIVLGPTPGAGPAPAIRDLEPVHRIVGMLSAVPVWVRLLVWPAHLQADYTPPGVPVTGPYGMAHGLGLGLLVVGLVILIRSWRSDRTITFGLAWIGLALFPVSNLITTTGVIVAERTLFLPSVGAMLALGGILAWLTPRVAAASPLRKQLGALTLGLLVVLGGVRSAERQLVWKDPLTFIRHLETDAPTAYRGQLMASVYYSEIGDTQAAERTAARAYALFKGDPQVFEQYGQTLRRQERCQEALPVLRDGVHRFPDRTVARSRLIECALAVGDTARARAVANEGVRIGATEFEQTIRRLDSRARKLP